ncbi:MAG: DUF2252 family protein [Bacteriovoracaceae bacterium]
MEEYFKLSPEFEKRVMGSPISRREARYLFFRMAGPIMQSKLYKFVDLSSIPQTFIHGNPHIDNYARNFHGSAMMDFDRSRIGPYCWDIIRFLSSISLRRNNDDGFLDRKVVENFIDAYIIHYLHPDIPSKQLKMLKTVEPEKWQLTSKEYLKANKKWAKKMREHLISPQSETVNILLKKFLDSRNESNLLNDYYISEVGITPGSLGKQHYIYSLMPKNIDSKLDAIILDIKEVYREKNNKFFYSPYEHHGLRMIEASKIFADGMEDRLGYCSVNNNQYWGRQIPTFAVKVKKYLDKDEQCDFAYSVGSELGKGHRKGLIDPKNPEAIEKDFQQNFDKYFKISKLFTYELRLAFEAIRRKQRLYNEFKSW